VSSASSSTPEPRFPEAYRRSIGVTLARFDELVRAARGHGVAADGLAEIETELAATAKATAARRPRPPRNATNAVLVQMLVLAEELRPRRMAGYGPLDDVSAALLEEHAQRLVDLTNDVIASVERASAAGSVQE
jgi:hypothetical protein